MNTPIIGLHKGSTVEIIRPEKGARIDDHADNRELCARLSREVDQERAEFKAACARACERLRKINRIASETNGRHA